MSTCKFFNIFTCTHKLYEPRCASHFKKESRTKELPQHGHLVDTHFLRHVPQRPEMLLQQIEGWLHLGSLQWLPGLRVDLEVPATKVTSARSVYATCRHCPPMCVHARTHVCVTRCKSHFLHQRWQQSNPMGTQDQ